MQVIFRETTARYMCTMRLRADQGNVEESLRSHLKGQGLKLVRLEGDGDAYAWFAHGERGEQIKGMMRKVSHDEYEMEVMPTLDETSDH